MREIELEEILPCQVKCLRVKYSAESSRWMFCRIFNGSELQGLVKGFDGTVQIAQFIINITEAAMDNNVLNEIKKYIFVRGRY